MPNYPTIPPIYPEEKDVIRVIKTRIEEFHPEFPRPVRIRFPRSGFSWMWAGIERESITLFPDGQFVKALIVYPDLDFGYEKLPFSSIIDKPTMKLW